MTTSPGPGPTARYSCRQCGEELPLRAVVDHLEEHLGDDVRAHLAAGVTS